MKTTITKSVSPLEQHVYEFQLVERNVGILKLFLSSYRFERRETKRHNWVIKIIYLGYGGHDKRPYDREGTLINREAFLKFIEPNEWAEIQANAKDKFIDKIVDLETIRSWEMSRLDNFIVL